MTRVIATGHHHWEERKRKPAGKENQKIGKDKGRSSSLALDPACALCSAPQLSLQTHWLCMCAGGTMGGYGTKVNYSWTHIGKNNSQDSVKYQRLNI